MSTTSCPTQRAALSEQEARTRTVHPVRAWRHKLAIGMLVLYATMLFVGTHLPRLTLPRVPSPIPVDKVLHFTAYALLTALILVLPTGIFRLPEGGFRRPSWLVACWIVLTIAVVGMLDELTQPLVGREFELADWGADVAGAMFMLLLVALGTSIYYSLVRMLRGSTPHRPARA